MLCSQMGRDTHIPSGLGREMLSLRPQPQHAGLLIQGHVCVCFSPRSIPKINCSWVIQHFTGENLTAWNGNQCGSYSCWSSNSAQGQDTLQQHCVHCQGLGRWDCTSKMSSYYFTQRQNKRRSVALRVPAQY